MNGSDDMLAKFDGNYLTPISALNAYRHRIISKETYFKIMENIVEKMKNIGVKDLNLRGSHILLMIDDSQTVVAGEDGKPQTRICNFEYLKRIEPINSHKKNYKKQVQFA